MNALAAWFDRAVPTDRKLSGRATVIVLAVSAAASWALFILAIEALAHLLALVAP